MRGRHYGRWFRRRGRPRWTPVTACHKAGRRSTWAKRPTAGGPPAKRIPLSCAYGVPRGFNPEPKVHRPYTHVTHTPPMRLSTGAVRKVPSMKAAPRRGRRRDVYRQSPRPRRGLHVFGSKMKPSAMPSGRRLRRGADTSAMRGRLRLVKTDWSSRRRRTGVRFDRRAQ